jgi:hypothetical protein
VQTSTASSWGTLLGPHALRSSDPSGTLALTVPPTSALLVKADGAVFAEAPAKPKLVIEGDALTSLWVATATVLGKAPVSVAFAVRRGTRWQRLDVDTSPPFRGFLDPAKFQKNEHVSVVAIARGLDGTTAVSAVMPFRVRAR